MGETLVRRTQTIDVQLKIFKLILLECKTKDCLSMKSVSTTKTSTLVCYFVESNMLGNNLIYVEYMIKQKIEEKYSNLAFIVKTKPFSSTRPRANDVQ